MDNIINIIKSNNFVYSKTEKGVIVYCRGLERIRLIKLIESENKNLELDTTNRMYSIHIYEKRTN